MELHGFSISRETLRHWMIEDGLWVDQACAAGQALRSEALSLSAVSKTPPLAHDALQPREQTAKWAGMKSVATRSMDRQAVRHRASRMRLWPSLARRTTNEWYAPAGSMKLNWQWPRPSPAAAKSSR